MSILCDSIKYIRKLWTRFAVIWYIFTVQVTGQYQFLFPANITPCTLSKILKLYQKIPNKKTTQQRIGKWGQSSVYYFTAKV